MHAKLLQPCPTRCDPMSYSPPSSTVHGISQARILELVASSSSRASSWPRDQIRASYVACIGRWVLYHPCHLGSSNQIIHLWWVLLFVYCSVAHMCMQVWGFVCKLSHNTARISHLDRSVWELDSVIRSVRLLNGCPDSSSSLLICPAPRLPPQSN